MAEVEESSCGGNGAVTCWTRRRAAIIHRGMAVNSLTDRVLRSCREESVIVVDIVVDRGSIFAREKITDVFMPRTAGVEDCWRAPLSFTLC